MPRTKEQDRIYMTKYLSDPKNREKHNIRQRNTKRLKRKLAVESLGGKCELCGWKNNFHIHEKRGKEHNRNPTYILVHLNDFALLCMRCHTGVHFAMDILGFEWKDIKKIINVRTEEFLQFLNSL